MTCEPLFVKDCEGLVDWLGVVVAEGDCDDEKDWLGEFVWLRVPATLREPDSLGVTEELLVVVILSLWDCEWL